MAADFYRSSHGNNWLVDRRALLAARALDLKYATSQEIAWIAIWGANAIQKLGKRLSLRQQVMATAVIFLRRFYLKNSYCETDLPLVSAACVYLAAKAEETAIHIKVVVTEARATFNEYGISNFPSDFTKLAEMEFYLLEDLEFHLIVYHPYRSLIQMTGRDSGPIAARKTTLDMDDNSMQMAWFVLNDTFRSELCLLYPPHMIAIASIYLAFSLHFPPSLLAGARAQQSARPSLAPNAILTVKGETGEPDLKRMRGQSFSGQPPGSLSPSTASFSGTGLTPANNNMMGSTSMPSSPLSGEPPASIAPKPPISTAPRGTTDPITFLASLNVQLPIVLEIVQEMLSLYACWKSYEEPPTPAATTTPATGAEGLELGSSRSSPSSNMPLQSPTRLVSGLTAGLPGGYPGMQAGRGVGGTQPGAGDERAIQILNRMRINRDMDLAHPANAGASTSSSVR